ncbi:MAG: HAD-IA family hydrolase [Candidatus Aenigmatarchaeota archaeon]|nr:HAD family hydrolase [Candidatus Aenigmarchaeota archaeon]
MLKAIIFDVDGVLLNNAPQVIKAFQTTARELGLRIPPEHEIRALFGQPWWVVLEKLFGHTPSELERNTYLKIWRSLEPEMQITEGVMEILPKLKLPLGLVTSKQSMTLKRQLSSVLKNFKVVITADDQTPGKYKPNPEPLWLACKKFGIQPKDAVYIGDTLNDLKSASMAGTAFIGFLGGGATLEEFQKAGAKHVATSMKELAKIIRGM